MRRSAYQKGYTNGSNDPHVYHDQAAAVPIAGLTALQALRDFGKLKAGEKVLINGASGGVGAFAVQIAKALGAEVTGVCSTRNLELADEKGAGYFLTFKCIRPLFGHIKRGPWCY